MDNDITIRIAGEAGQGMQTIGVILCQVFKNAGASIFANQDYMSRVRGGNNFFQLRIADKPLFTLRQKADIIVVLDQKSVGTHKADLAKKGIMVVDKNKFTITQEESAFFDIPLYNLAAQSGSDIFVSAVSCGAIIGMTEIDFGRLTQVIKSAFADKAADIIEKNILAAQAGYEFTRNNYKKERFSFKSLPAKDTLLINGNEAIALGAIRSGCKFYSAYPMTPSTSIMDTISHYAKRFNIVVEQAEDEIAAINMALGASFAGARSMTATSGGGFALMTEGVSLAGMTETPVVIVVAQRPAPATGFPTRTEQADMDFVIHSGHGEFARAVYTPGTIEQAFYLTVKAFNLAEKYQIPVFIMTDQHLADGNRDIAPFDLKKTKVKRFVISKEDSAKVSGYKRYTFTANGISPRAIPSWINDVIYVDSDEHTEEGHITEDGEIRTKMVKKRLYKKMSGLSQEIEKPTVYNIDKARVILVGFGSTYGVMKEVSESFEKKKVGFVHLSQVWPFPSKEISRLLKKAKKVFTVENNAGGQLARLMKRECGVTVTGSILKFDGRPFDLDYLSAALKRKGA